MKFYTETDVAEILNVDEETVTLWRRRYGWPHVKIGRQVRFTDADLHAIQAGHHVQADKTAGLAGQTSLSARRSA